MVSQGGLSQFQTIKRLILNICTDFQTQKLSSLRDIFDGQILVDNWREINS